MVDTLAPTDADSMLLDVQATEDGKSNIQGGSDAFFDAIAQTILDEQGQELTPEKTRELAEALKGVMEFSTPGLISSLNTGDVGGLTAEELNVALDSMFIGHARTSITRDGIEAASSVFESLGIAKEDLSLEAQIAMSGIMTQVQDYTRQGFGVYIPETSDPFAIPHNETPGVPASPNNLDQAAQPDNLTCDELRQTLPIGSNKGCFDI